MLLHHIGRTLHAVRQGVVDVRLLPRLAGQSGLQSARIVGTSLGSCYAFIAAAHDPRISVAAFNHASTYVADVVWRGQSTRHIRKALEADIDLDRLRRMWLAVSPMSYFDRFHAGRAVAYHLPKYDLTFLPDLSRQVVDEFERHELNHKVVFCPAAITQWVKHRTNIWTLATGVVPALRRSRTRNLLVVQGLDTPGTVCGLPSSPALIHRLEADLSCKMSP